MWSVRGAQHRVGSPRVRGATQEPSAAMRGGAGQGGAVQCGAGQGRVGWCGAGWGGAGRGRAVQGGAGAGRYRVGWGRAGRGRAVWGGAGWGGAGRCGAVRCGEVPDVDFARTGREALASGRNDESRRPNTRCANLARVFWTCNLSKQLRLCELNF